MADFGLLSRGQPHSPDVNHCVIHFRPEGHGKPRNQVGSLSLAERLVDLNRVPSDSYHKALTH